MFSPQESVHGRCCCCSVVSSCLRPYGLQPARLLCSWDSPGKNTGVGSRALFQGIFPTQGSNPGLLNWQLGSLLLSHKGSLHGHKELILLISNSRVSVKGPTFGSIYPNIFPCRETPAWHAHAPSPQPGVCLWNIKTGLWSWDVPHRT